MQATMERRIPALIAAAIIACAALMTGCASNNQPEPISVQEESASSSSSGVSVAIGGETGTSAAVELENSLGGTVTFMSIAPAGSEGQPAELAIEGGSWADGQAATLNYEPVPEAAAYDLVLNVDDTLYDLHDVALGDMERATVKLEGTFAYLVYEHDGSSVSTLEHEREVAAQAQAQAEAAAQAAADAAAAEQAAAEQAAAEQAAADAAAAEQEVYYEEPVTYYEPAPAVESAPAPAQSGDQCVEGGVLLR